MYIYLVKYKKNIIAAADSDSRAEAVIKQYMRNNKDMKLEDFDLEPIRFFKEGADDR